MEMGKKSGWGKQLRHLGFWSKKVVSISKILGGVERHLENRIDMTCCLDGAGRKKEIAKNKCAAMVPGKGN